MKKLISTLALLLAFGSITAQDIILKKDATEIPARVMKVGSEEIEFKKWDNPDGPIYAIPTQDVFIIKYQNGTKDIISDLTHRNKPAWKGKYPRYQGELAVAYGLGVGVVSDLLPTNRVVFETVHGIRFNPYLFTGLGVGFNYFYEEFVFADYHSIAAWDGAGILPAFINLKGYYPFNSRVSAYLSLDLGAAIGISGWADGKEFYTSIGPGINFGGAGSSSRFDLSIRFQHMGEGLNAVLFRIGFGF